MFAAVQTEMNFGGPPQSPVYAMIMAELAEARARDLTIGEAEKRVNDVIVQAMQAADDARKAMAKLMLWFAASMLAGAVASILGATEGGVLRDPQWYEPGWRASTVRNHWLLSQSSAKE